MVGRTCTESDESVNDFHKALLFWKFQAMDTSSGEKNYLLHVFFCYHVQYSQLVIPCYLAHSTWSCSINALAS